MSQSMDAWYKPLQGVNYHKPLHDTNLDYEQSGVLARLVGFGMVLIYYVWLGNQSRYLWLGGVTYWWKVEVTYSLGKVVNFVIELISHSKYEA
jgi:hypothetical protein